MPTLPNPVRISPSGRDRLFEYLRQSEAGALADRHLTAENRARVPGMAEAFQMDLALRSWRMQAPVLKPRSAPEPRRHHEFFRAVRA